MYRYSIMPLNTEHIDEICEDIKNQYESGVAECILFYMALVPEGNPPINKAEIMCQQYDVFAQKLSAMGIKCGMLVQASIGHGYPLNQMNPFQQYTGLSNGEKQYVCCPYDVDFRHHFKNVMRTLASHKPAVIMVDDDFRLMFWREGKGCACPLHMAELNRRANTNMSRAELYESLCREDDEAKRLLEIFVQTQRESLIGAAKSMREGIDSVDPTIPGIYCTAGGEFAAEIAAELAGKGNPTIVRINNGNYTPAGARNLSYSMLRAAMQIATMRHSVDVFLAETDTCPQNRYSTGAQSLHTHFTGSLLEGTNGAKHWITRLRAYEPNSGKAYRKTLSKYDGFYRALADVVPTLKPVGCRIPLPDKVFYRIDEKLSEFPSYGWTCCVLERLGLPLYFSERDDGAVFLDGNTDAYFSDTEILNMLACPVFLAVDTAQNLIQRGFGKYIGVDVRKWNGEQPSGELVCGNHTSVQVNTHELIPQSESTFSISTVFHIPDGKTKKELFPGVTGFKNQLGGTVFVFCGTPKAEFNHVQAFSFLNESRKNQLVQLLQSVNRLPVYYPDDAEVYLRAAKMPDGSLFVAVFNIGLDPLDDIPLVCEGTVNHVEHLTPEGKRETCAFQKKADRIVVKTPAYTLHPVILFIS